MSERFCPCGAVASGFAERLLYRPGRFIYVAESNTYRYPGEGGVMQNRLVEAQPGETAPRQMHAESATSRFSFLFSSRSCRNSRSSLSPRPAYFFLHK